MPDPNYSLVISQATSQSWHVNLLYLSGRLYSRFFAGDKAAAKITAKLVAQRYNCKIIFVAQRTHKFPAEKILVRP